MAPNLKEAEAISHGTPSQDVKRGVEFDIVVTPPTFGLEDLRKAIPRDCFKRNLGWSIFYFLRDLFFIGSVYFLVYRFNDLFHHYSYVAFPLFWMVQGFLFWALFVVGHDCGHRSFSDNDTINDFFGHVSHTLILVPFHSWRLSHKKHHENTGHADNDESFVPPSEDTYKGMTAVEILIRFQLYWLGGWPMYLLRGMPNTYYSHLNADAALFKDDERHFVRESVRWIKGWAAVLTGLTLYFGFTFMLKYYWGPYLVFAFWIALVTHSHHTHPDVPWYRGEQWNFLRGALSTVDRNYGPGIEHIHHNIGTHVVHHIFSKIPHYNLLEASASIQPILGKHHRRSSSPFWNTMVLMARTCRFVSTKGDVVFYQPDAKKSQ